MPSYRPSTGRHWCEYCRTWVQPDPMSIRNHEAGERHKAAQKQFTANTRKEKIDAQKEKDEVSRIIREAEISAREAMARDKALFQPLPTSVPSVVVSASPQSGYQGVPPPPLPPSNSLQKPMLPSNHMETAIEPELEPEPWYMVRGKYYLMGDYADKFLVEGASVDYLSPADEVWNEAVILKKLSIPVPNTNIINTQITIELSSGVKSGALLVVPPSSLRISLSEDEISSFKAEFEKKKFGETNEVAEDVKPAPIVDENTGVGVWTSTVIVEEDSIDEDAVELNQLDRDLSKALDKYTDKVKEKESAAVIQNEYFDEGVEVGNFYKGKRLDELDTSSTVVVPPPSVNTKPVEIKARAINQKGKRRRDDSDDD